MNLCTIFLKQRTLNNQTNYFKMAASTFTMTREQLEKNNWMSVEDKNTIRAVEMRQRMGDRKPHILDPRTRRIGIDVDALNQQVMEKRELNSREKAREDAFAHMTLTQQDLLMENAERERQLRRKMDEDRDKFRMAQQRPDQAREYDIWRPDLLKVSRPARIGDYDPTIGISSGQIFQGEDLKISERLAAQARQRNEWFQEQTREKDAIRRKEQMDDLTNQLVELETQKKLAELDRMTEHAKAEVRKEIADDNLRMFHEKKQNEADQHALEQMQNDAELKSNLRTRIISEEMCPRGGHPMEYRGMTIDEQKQIIDEQSRQMVDNERRRQEEAERERQWYEYQEYLKSEGDRNEAMWLRRKQQEQAALYQTHLQQEEEFKRRERYLNKVVYGQNIPDDYYYNQWGKDVR
ncbi:flagellar protofilament ribbon protein [Tritrichomonas foetus]|uniref:Flagellar protofilament ribbon protein n=1 Tax=Tritrichomonas foetus TaxID=1144522 RepID=A0A1J4JTV9_9EUKA|nr:flagellar protofilament ribbon protein [Tritrichomonas foetus]|eukprot:OHT00942.1 flagellar protofilament ribbon protein [Tritrichomonas foetus]